MFICVLPSPRATHAEGRRVVVPEGEETAIVRLAREFSPRVEPWRDGGVLLDAAGLGHLFGDDRALARAIGDAALTRGFLVRVAVAATRTAAGLLAHARPGITIVPAGTEAAALVDLPLEILRTGTCVRPADEAERDRLLRTLRRWGVDTLGALAALPSDELYARFGAPGVRLQQRARGEDDQPLVSAPEQEPLEARMALDWPVAGLEPLAFVLARLIDVLAGRLEQADAGATVVETSLRLVTRETIVRRLELPAPLRDSRVLRTLVLLDLESHPLDATAEGIDEVGVVLTVARRRILQYSLFDPARPSPERRSTLLARLGALMGTERVGAPTLVDSHRPGAFAMTGFEPEDRPGAGGTRPGVPVIRRFRLPVPARVLLEGGRPVRVMTERPGLQGGRVERCAGPWRTSGAWWEDAAPASSSSWDQDVWDVALGDGGIYRLCYDRLRGRWSLEGVVD